MKIATALQNIKEINIPNDSPPVVQTTAEECRQLTHSSIKIKKTTTLQDRPGVFHIGMADSSLTQDKIPIKTKQKQNGFIYFMILEDGSGRILASKSNLLFSFFSYLAQRLKDQDIEAYQKGKIFTPAFKWNRIVYDFFLTQEGRIQKGLNREKYILEQARLGFSHIEVNSLAFPEGLEKGPKGEIYPMFYTYCPALDQFVYSRLNKSLYPQTYLSANLALLKSNAQTAIRYGLTPGLLCFEPRSVPESFFAKYPMLRGARVDHPFRSFKPRYNMTVAHPLVLKHYAEMITKLLRDVPELEFISIWTNDSGAGFEYTKSLYVGRNGGAYLVREWKDDCEIAKIAGENALRFFCTLKEAAQRINPEFRVITRMEPFYGEHDTIWEGLGHGLDVETSCLAAKGWELPFSHPKYPDVKNINAGTVYQNRFDNRDKNLILNLKKKQADAHYYFAAGPNAMFAPLLGIPFPRLTFERLKLLFSSGVENLAHQGGIQPPDLVPYNINHEIVRLFLFNPDMYIEKEIERLALNWTGEKYHRILIKTWRFAEKAILAFPNVSALYSTYGFTWYRLWVRPFVPNMESVLPKDRTFYEDHMCTTPHNPNNVDLSRDVLFHLTFPKQAELVMKRIDKNVWEPLDRAISFLEGAISGEKVTPGSGDIIHDQLIRLSALRCWFMTQRNVAAWINGVYGYQEARNKSEKDKYRSLVTDLIEKEIINTKSLKVLLESGVKFMAMTDLKETPLIHGNNLSDNLNKRVEIMRAHIDDEPYINPDYIEEKAKKRYDQTGPK